MPSPSLMIGQTDQANPIMVEATRGGIVESQHRGRAVVVDRRGEVYMQWGDIDKMTFPRSAVKSLQFLPAVIAGAADKAGFTPAQFALACSSHNGEAFHCQTAHAMLLALGLDEPDLRCGVHWPMREETARELAAKQEKPNQLHNNCSGKHAAMLALAKLKNYSLDDYQQPQHPVQLTIRDFISQMCEYDLTIAPMGIDGCSVPTWALPLRNLALGFARLANPEVLAADWRQSILRIRQAVAENPQMIAGTGRYCSRMSAAFGCDLFLKVGAEGVFCASLPRQGYGIAIKADDGSDRAAEMILTAVLREIGLFDELNPAVTEQIRDIISPNLINRAGLVVGRVRPHTGSFSL